jgi:hypothetical protein
MSDNKNYDMTFAGAQEAALVGGQHLRNLVYYGKLQNVTIVNGKSENNPYLGKMDLNYKRDEPVGISSLGTPVYSDLTLLGVEYTDNITGKPVQLQNDRYRSGKNQPVAGNNSGLGTAFYMNIETVLITVSQAANIIKTKIQGRNGTVKEYIGLDDSTVTINGVITGKNGVYPFEEVERLRRWLQAPVSKGIVARWLGNLGIENLVVESYDIPQVEGGYSYQMFSISAISDLPVELKIYTPV